MTLIVLEKRDVKMKVMKQFGIILAITFAGEVLHGALPLPIPASIYGLILMLAGLMTKIIKVDDVGDAALFLIETMPMMFIPAAVGLLDSWGVLKSIFVPIIIITLVSTIIVMAVSGLVTQKIIRMRKQEGDNE